MNLFYEANYRQYFASTVNIDPASFLTPLTRFLAPQSTTLDIGCGSGRDLLWLAERGFKPTGLEQSTGLASLAREHADCPVIEGDFCTFDFSGLAFDALVLVGALVHLPRSSLHVVLASITKALIAGGCMLITMKEGIGCYSLPDGRQFTLWGKEEIEEVYQACGLEVVDFSRQVSRLRPKDIWLGHVLQRVSEIVPGDAI